MLRLEMSSLHERKESELRESNIEDYWDWIINSEERCWFLWKYHKNRRELARKLIQNSKWRLRAHSFLDQK